MKKLALTVTTIILTMFAVNSFARKAVEAYPGDNSFTIQLKNYTPNPIKIDYNSSSNCKKYDSSTIVFPGGTKAYWNARSGTGHSDGGYVKLIATDTITGKTEPVCIAWGMARYGASSAAAINKASEIANAKLSSIGSYPYCFKSEVGSDDNLYGGTFMLATTNTLASTSFNATYRFLATGVAFGRDYQEMAVVCTFGNGNKVPQTNI